MAEFEEREIKEAAELCDAKGNLNPSAVGWSRFPLHLCNLKGHWPRKKCWNSWTILSDEFMFTLSMTNADIVSFVTGCFVDFETEECLEQNEIASPGKGCEMPAIVEAGLEHKGKKMQLEFLQRDNGVTIKAQCENFGGKEMAATVDIDIPDWYESLNVVVPWGPAKFKYSSRQISLPAIGIIRINGRTYTCDPSNAFATMDFNRSVSPQTGTWNSVLITGRHGSDIVGANFTSGPSRGTGLTLNGVLLNGKMHKISEEVVFRYDQADMMKPWSIQSEESETVDLAIEPFYERKSSFNIKVVKTCVTQVFGKLLGTILIGDRMLALNGINGWVEEIDSNI